jgi:uncharacterized oxidoreductase
MNIKGNTILITGGTSGIGLAFAEELYREGNTIIITGRSEEKLKEIKLQLPEIITIVSDVASAEQRSDLILWIKENYPDTNMLINNAGVQYITDFNSNLDLQKVVYEVETNLTAPIHLAALFVPLFKGKEHAAIINITSGLAFVPIGMMAVYCATKAAMHSLTLSLRYQLKDSAIKVFEIAPPAVDTNLGHDRRKDKGQSHGGIPVHEFIKGAMEALVNDEFEAAIGQAAMMREHRESFFDRLNGFFKA